VVWLPLSVAVHKDIAEYREKVVGKLSLRTLLCVAGGLATSVAVAALCYRALGVLPADASLPVMAASIPFWLAGFWRPYGMEAERFIPLLVEHVAGDGLVLYVSSDRLAGGPDPLPQRTTPAHRRRCRRKGDECREPSVEAQGQE
jgi:hypothetical protein